MDEDKYCVNCKDDSTLSTHKCKLCDSGLCKKCSLEGTFALYDWLEDCSNRCSKCKEIGCYMCLSICCICANEGEKDLICVSCSKDTLIEYNCPNEELEVCKEHIGEECPACYAWNREWIKH